MGFFVYTYGVFFDYDPPCKVYVYVDADSRLKMRDHAWIGWFVGVAHNMKGYAGSRATADRGGATQHTHAQCPTQAGG